MASDYGMRGAAAGRLMKGKKGAPPPEDDLGLPPEDAGMPPEGGGGLGDLAAMLGGGPPGEVPMEEGLPPEGEGAPPAEPDLDTALGGVEAALGGIPEEAAEEIRTHLNAIREIAARSGGGSPMMPEEAPPTSPAPPQPDGGASAGMSMMEPQV